MNTTEQLHEKKTRTSSRVEASPRSTLLFLLIAVATFLMLFLSMDLRVGPYDEGFILTAAMREMAGQIPHRDFYFAYGPAQTYLLAFLFHLFGPSVFVARLLDLLFKSLLTASFHTILQRLVRPWLAAAATAVLFLMLFALPMPGSPGVPVSLASLWATWLLLPAFSSLLSSRQAFAAGALTAAALLFRYDVGGALAVFAVLALIIASFAARSGKRQCVREVTTYIAGVLALVAPAACAYLAVASISDIKFDIFDYPAHLFRAGRQLPFPSLTLKTLDNLAIFLPFAAILLALAFVTHRLIARKPLDRRVAAMIAFGLIAMPLSIKGVVRISPVQMYLALIPTLLLLAVVADLWSELSRILHLSLVLTVAAALISTLWLVLHKCKDLNANNSSAIAALRHTPPKSSGDPLRVGLPFDPGSERQHAIDFIRAFTAPTDPLYVGVTHHDRIYVNDNLTYFATQRLPATKWSEFDPGLQNQALIQEQMIAALNRKPPPYILLDADWDEVREPNASSISSGVFLLDSYLRANYTRVRTWGAISAWQRK